MTAPASLTPEPAPQMGTRHGHTPAQPPFDRTPLQLIDRPTDDAAATEQTIGYMKALAAADAHSATVRAAVDVASQGARTPAELVERIWTWVKRRVRFVEDRHAAQLAGVPDPDDTEVLIRPSVLLQMRAPGGDCDDHAMLTAAMLGAAGIKSSFVAIEADPEFPGTYSHVYVVAHTPSGDVSMDTSHGPYFGWQATPTPGGKVRKWRVPMMTDATEARQLGDVFSDSLSWINPIQPQTSFWQDLLKSGVDTTNTILKARLAQPPVGTYMQSAAGDVFYRQPGGVSDLAFPGVGVNVGGSLPAWLIVAGIGVVALLVLGGNHR